MLTVAAMACRWRLSPPPRPEGALLCIHSCEEAESLMRVLELRFTGEDLAKAKEHVDMQTTRRPRGKPSPRRGALLPRMIAGWLREAL